MRTKKHFLILLVLSLFLLFGNSCVIYRRHPNQGGEVITTRPYGREHHGRRIKITDDHHEGGNDRDDDRDRR